MFENPSSSTIGRVVASLSVFFILISTVSFCLETLPQFKDKYDEFGLVEGGGGLANASDGLQTAPMKPWDPARKSFPFWLTESICIAFFTFEFVGRFATCPNKCMFIREIGNLIDILAVIPYYFSLGVEIIFMKMNESSAGMSKTSEKVAFLALLRVIRILSDVDQYSIFNRSKKFRSRNRF